MPFRRSAIVLGVSLCLALPALAQEEPPAVSPAVPPPDVAAPPDEAEVTASGLASRILTAGAGTTHPGPHDAVVVHYTGWTTEGHLFDSSVLRGRPAALMLDRVIAGWTEGLQLMVVGEKRRFWIPGGLAYEGVEGRPQGTLVFDIELLDHVPIPQGPPSDVASAPDDAERTRSGLVTKVLQSGHGVRHPGDRSTVVVHYSGWTTNGEMFDSSMARGTPVSLRLDQVIDGWAEGLRLMVEGERRRLWIPQALAYGGQAGAPRGTLVFDVHLIAIE